jgi:putative hydrolase of the HAD superfamily
MHHRAALGLAQLFDVVVNSARVGVAKPDLGVYRFAVARLGVVAERCVFVDDQRANVSAAATLGMIGVCYTDWAAIRAILAELGLLA